MPASSMGELNSWGLYLLASAALVLLLSPQLFQVVAISRASADWRNLDGARAAIDSLRPGIVVPFSFGASKVSDPLRLQGDEISCADGNGSISMRVGWALPNYTLYPATGYLLSLAQGSLVVAQAV